MPGMGRIEAKQLPNLGETPAEARKRMESSSGAEVEQPRGTEVEGPLRAEHLAAIEAEEGGFKDTGRSDGPPQDLDDLAEPPSPSKAMEVINQLSQEKNQAFSELDAALALVQRYRAKFGELD
jgi:hypothetical protein